MSISFPLRGGRGARRRVVRPKASMCNPRGQGRPLLSFPILSLDRHFFDDRRWVMLGENPQLELRPPGSRAGALRFKRKDPKRLTDSRAHVARTPPRLQGGRTGGEGEATRMHARGALPQPPDRSRRTVYLRYHDTEVKVDRCLFPSDSKGAAVAK